MKQLKSCGKGSSKTSATNTAECTYYRDEVAHVKHFLWVKTITAKVVGGRSTFFRAIFFLPMQDIRKTSFFVPPVANNGNR